MRATDAALLIATLVISWSFYRAHRNRNIDFNFFDILLENGKVSRLACIAMGAFLVASWIMVRLTMDGKITEGHVGLYLGACFSPIVAKLFAPAPLNPPA